MLTRRCDGCEDVLTPGAITSGFNRSPPPAANCGPRDEKAAVNGAGSLKVIVDWLIVAVAPGVAGVRD